MARLEDYLITEEMTKGWDNLNEAPIQAKGWTQESLKKFGKTIGVDPKEKGFHEACVKRMKGRVDTPEAFCASIKDAAYGSPMWRGKEKTKKEAEKGAKEVKFKKQMK